MTSSTPISFGDNVRVRPTSETEAAGLAGLSGTVYGETTPSVTGVEVIGQLKEDFALNVFFQTRDEAYWLVPELLEFVDHAPGTEMTVEGAATKWVRSETGQWEEVPTAEKQPGLIDRLLRLFRQGHYLDSAT